jgi:hypothetical protein
MPPPSFLGINAANFPHPPKTLICPNECGRKNWNNPRGQIGQWPWHKVPLLFPSTLCPSQPFLPRFQAVLPFLHFCVVLLHPQHSHSSFGLASSHFGVFSPFNFNLPFTLKEASNQCTFSNSNFGQFLAFNTYLLASLFQFNLLLLYLLAPTSFPAHLGYFPSKKCPLFYFWVGACLWG